jgi:hypothetical protein
LRCLSPLQRCHSNKEQPAIALRERGQRSAPAGRWDASPAPGVWIGCCQLAGAAPLESALQSPPHRHGPINEFGMASRSGPGIGRPRTSRMTRVRLEEEVPRGDAKPCPEPCPRLGKSNSGLRDLTRANLALPSPTGAAFKSLVMKGSPVRVRGRRLYKGIAYCSRQSARQSDSAGSAVGHTVPPGLGPVGGLEPRLLDGS